MFANLFAEFLQVVFGSATRIDRPDFIAKLNAKESKWMVEAYALRAKVNAGFTRSNDDLWGDLGEFKKYKPLQFTSTIGSFRQIEQDIQDFEW
jgi:hypothetical protein